MLLVLFNPKPNTIKLLSPHANEESKPRKSKVTCSRSQSE